jgi:23S rRNA pseudouridine1911/1915/1917 synthase
VAHEVRWVVRPGDGVTVGEVIARAFGDAAAISEGRVFVGRVRASDPGAPVTVGDVVTLGARRDAADSVALLADEDGIVAVDKPAGMPTIPDQGGSAHSLLVVLAKTLGCAPGDLHPTSRLDRDVSGVVLFARTPEAAERLAQARATGAYLRRYVAIASRSPEPPSGEWNAPIGRASDPKKRAAFGRDATHATTSFETLATAGGRAVLALEPVSGRTHQIRVHAAHAQAPLLGDRAYGGDTRIVLDTGRVLAVRRIALHAALVVVPRPNGPLLDVRSPVPPELRELWSAMGGEEGVWESSRRGGGRTTPT